MTIPVQVLDITHLPPEQLQVHLLPGEGSEQPQAVLFQVCELEDVPGGCVVGWIVRNPKDADMMINLMQLARDKVWSSTKLRAKPAALALADPSRVQELPKSFFGVTVLSISTDPKTPARLLFRAGKPPAHSAGVVFTGPKPHYDRLLRTLEAARQTVWPDVPRASTNVDVTDYRRSLNP